MITEGYHAIKNTCVVAVLPLVSYTGKSVTNFGEMRHRFWGKACPFFWEKQARLLVAVLNAKNVGVWILEVLGLGVSEK